MQYTRTSAVLAAGAAAVIALAGCSTSTSSPSTPPTTPPATPTASPTVTDVLPPIEIDGKKTEVDATVGDTLDVISDGVTSVSTNNDAVLRVSQPHTDGSAEFNAGAEVVGAGTAKLTVTGATGGDYTVTVTAIE